MKTVASWWVMIPVRWTILVFTRFPRSLSGCAMSVWHWRSFIRRKSKKTNTQDKCYTYQKSLNIELVYCFCDMFRGWNHAKSFWCHGMALLDWTVALQSIRSYWGEELYFTAVAVIIKGEIAYFLYIHHWRWKPTTNWSQKTCTFKIIMYIFFLHGKRLHCCPFKLLKKKGSLVHTDALSDKFLPSILVQYTLTSAPNVYRATAKFSQSKCTISFVWGHSQNNESSSSSMMTSYVHSETKYLWPIFND